eukprot:c28934_g1_i2 orf=545-1456(-)
MDSSSGNWYNGGYHAMVAQDRRQREREEAYAESLTEDLGESFQLPITHRPTENLDTDNLEQSTVDTQIAASNVGFRLLQKMGWKGKGLGKDEQGIVEPIKAGSRDAKLGLGKQEQDDFYTAEENIHRRKLDVELEETHELARKREVEAEREQKIRTEINEIRKVFFCELCNKQYRFAMEFDAHLSSYDHSHKKRFKELRDLRTAAFRDSRLRREEVRQEREIARFAQLVKVQRAQQQGQQEAANSAITKTGTSVPVQEQRTALKFEISAKSAFSRVSPGAAVKKTKVAPRVPSVFRDGSEEDA